MRTESRRENGDAQTDDESHWAFMRRMVLVTPEGKTYLQRVRIVETPWFALYLHKMEVPDPGIDLHDHPWWFASLILRGGYDEYIEDTRHAPPRAQVSDQWNSVARGDERRWRAGSLHRLRLTEAHRICRLHRSPTWTLVLTGPRRRSWGFYQPEGFVDHHYYNFAVRRLLKAS